MLVPAEPGVRTGDVTCASCIQGRIGGQCGSQCKLRASLVVTLTHTSASVALPSHCRSIESPGPNNASAMPSPIPSLPPFFSTLPQNSPCTREAPMGEAQSWLSQQKELEGLFQPSSPSAPPQQVQKSRPGQLCSWTICLILPYSAPIEVNGKMPIDFNGAGVSP